MFKIELNNARQDNMFVNNKLKKNSPIVEIFEAIATGKDLSKYGKKVDKVYERIRELAERANNGDYVAKAEINTIVRYAIEPKLLDSMQLFNFMGTFTTIPYNEQPMMKTYKHESLRSNFQATHGDVPFATYAWEEYPITTQTISGGYAVDYREVASGNFDRVAEGMEQVQTTIRNKAVLYVIKTMYDAIKNATGVKYFAESNGIQKDAVDAVLKKVRRLGRPSIMGDYSVVSQLNDFAGFKADPSDTKATGLSEAVMEEIRQTGLLSTYKGSPVVELPNAYDFATLNNAGDNFKTLLPEGLLFFVPQGTVAPLQIFQRGGLTSMTGVDIVTGKEMTRFDLEVGAGVAKGREFEIGIVSDLNFEAPEA